MYAKTEIIYTDMLCMAFLNNHYSLSTILNITSVLYYFVAIRNTPLFINKTYLLVSHQDTYC